MSITDKLSETVGQAFAANDLPADLGVVRVSDRPDLAQFQCNGAMAAAKIAKKNPREVAGQIQKYLHGFGHDAAGYRNTESTTFHSPDDKIFKRIEIAGPGFINLDVTDEFLAQHMAAIAADEKRGVQPIPEQETIVLDYGGPNIAKPMHVGHLRAAIIGDTMRRILDFAGYKALGDVHMGDWGTHMGMIISEYIREGRQDFVLQTDTNNSDQVAALMKDLSALYPKVAAACKNDETRKKEAQDATLKIQSKAPEYFALWQKIKDASIVGMRNNYALLDVHFNLWKGEADVHDYIAPMVDDLKDRDFAVEDQGALVVNVKRNDDKKEVPPLILYKSDGGVLYGTTDMATLVERIKLYKPTKVLYFVDQRQHLHFEQVFRAAKMAGIVPEKVELTHAGFGTMNGTDGKPFKTRAGGVMRLDDLIDMGLEKAQQRLGEAALAQDMDDAEKDDVAHKVAIAAIKFADLQNQRQSDYVFDLDRLTSFEGKTGPYLLYQGVRIKSLLKKAQEQGLRADKFDFVFEDVDRPLALLLTEFPDAFDLTVKSYAPHHLCEYAFKLAQQFSSFYGSCHILSEENETLRDSRLSLCLQTYNQLETVLYLLGISIPDRM